VHELNSFLPLTSFDFFSAFVIRTQVRWIFPADIFRFLFPITVFRAACRSSSPFLILSCQEIFQLKSLLPAEFGSCRSPVLVFLRRSVRRLVGLVIPKDWTLPASVSFWLCGSLIREIVPTVRHHRWRIPQRAWGLIWLSLPKIFFCRLRIPHRVCSIFDLLALSCALVIFRLLMICPFRCFLGQAQRFVPAARIGIFESKFSCSRVRPHRQDGLLEFSISHSLIFAVCCSHFAAHV
jgi:hypothetical protein